MLALFYTFNIIMIITTIISKDIVSAYICITILLCVLFYLFETSTSYVIGLILHFSTILYTAMFISSYSPTTPYFLFVIIIDVIFFIYYAIVFAKQKMH